MTGFSHSTISRVLNGKAKEFRISDGACKTIWKAAEEINYRPSMLARALRLKKTMSIGLIVPDIKNPFFGELAWRIEIRLRAEGYSTIICNTDSVPANEKSYLRTLSDREVDGVLLVPIHSREWGELEEISQRKSVVLIVRSLNNTSLPCVISNNLQAAQDLTSEVINLGYSRIGFLGGTPGSFINKSRLQGYQNALKASRLPYEEKRVLCESFSIDAGERMMNALLQSSPDIDAVFCVNNLVFLGAMKAMNQSASGVRERIMMAAFDIARHSGLFYRPMISATQNLAALTEKGVSLLLDAIGRHPVAHCPVSLPVQIEKYHI